jgi:uncharacterized membrane protein YidH (DUF202 family)
MTWLISAQNQENTVRVNLITLVGVTLIVLGIVAFTYRGIPYRSREKVIDAGSSRTNVSVRKIIPMSPLSIGFVLVGGAVLIAVGSAKLPKRS